MLSNLLRKLLLPRYALIDRVQRMLFAPSRTSSGIRVKVQKTEKQVKVLNESKEWRCSIVNLIADFAYAFRVEADNSIVQEWISDTFTTTTGFAQNELSPVDGWMRLIHTDDLPKTQQRLEILLSGQPNISEFRIMTKENDVVWLRDYSHPVWDETEQRVTGICGAVRNLTEDKKRENLFVEEQRLLRNLIDNLPDHIYAKNNKSRFLLVNEAVKRHLGASTIEEVIGKTDFDFSPAELARQYYAEEQLLFQTGQPLIGHYEVIFDHATATRRWVSATKIPFYDSEGQIAGLVGLNRDITKLKIAEQALQCERDFAESLIETAQVIILVLDTEGRIIRFNPYLAEISGYDLTEVGGKDWCSTFLPVYYQKQFHSIFSQALKGNQTQGNVTPLLTKNGSLRQIEWHDKALKDSQGNTIGLLMVGQDFTERLRAEEEKRELFEEVSQHKQQLRALAKQLAETQEAERKVLARELHDQVGQNLTALDLNLNIMQTQLLYRWGNEFDSVKARLDDSLVLVSQTAERIRNVMSHLRPPMLDDYGLVAALRWYTQQFGSRVNFTIDLQVEEITPRLDAAIEDMLFRIVQEALTNVAKHAQANQVTLCIQKNAKFVKMILSDDGKGFIPLKQNARSKPQHWGLITMVERAEAIGGQCRVESKLGHGTQIIVKIPLS